MSDTRQMYMVHIRDVVHVAVYAEDAIEAVRLALAERYGVRAEDVQAEACTYTYRDAPNLRWTFTLPGGDVYTVIPCRVVRRPKTVTALAEFVGAPKLPFAEV